MTAVADAAAANLQHLPIQAHLQFPFQFQKMNLQQDVQLDNIRLMVFACGILFLFHLPFNKPVLQDTLLMETEPAFQFLIQQTKQLHQFQFLLAPLDITVMETETALLHLMLLQLFLLAHHAQVDTSLMEMEFVLQLIFQLFVFPDMKVMDKEVVNQLLLLSIMIVRL